MKTNAKDLLPNLAFEREEYKSLLIESPNWLKWALLVDDNYFNLDVLKTLILQLSDQTDIDCFFSGEDAFT